MEELEHTFYLAHNKIVFNRRIIIGFIFVDMIPFFLLELNTFLSFIFHEYVNLTIIVIQIVLQLELTIVDAIMTYFYVRAS